MPNWGVPDFDARTAEQQAIDASAPDLRAQLKAQGLMVEWPHNDKVKKGYSPEDVKHYCLDMIDWQALRISMKGKPTDQKLSMLKTWWDKHMDGNSETWKRAAEVQVGNYLGALRRGGQLDDQNRVRKYL